MIPKPKQIISSKAVLDSVAHRPRTHLGDVVYDPIIKTARLQDPRTGRPPRVGYSSTPRPLPWDLIEDRENCTLTMKIGKEHLTATAREEITSRRAVWGTDVYTDDSDVVAACIHAGWIRGEWPDEVDISMLGLDEGVNAAPEPEPTRAGGRSRNTGKNSTKTPAPAPAKKPLPVMNVLTEPPKTGPMVVPENRDLHVTLLILPRLEKYASTTRFGLKSREFGGIVTENEETRKRAMHDGISFMVMGIRWVMNGGSSQNRLRGKARRERIRKALREVELGSLSGYWGGNGNGDGDAVGEEGAGVAAVNGGTTNATTATATATTTGGKTTTTLPPPPTSMVSGADISAGWWEKQAADRIGGIAAVVGGENKENQPVVSTAGERSPVADVGEEVVTAEKTGKVEAAGAEAEGVTTATAEINGAAVQVGDKVMQDKSGAEKVSTSAASAEKSTAASATASSIAAPVVGEGNPGADGADPMQVDEPEGGDSRAPTQARTQGESQPEKVACVVAPVSAPVAVAVDAPAPASSQSAGAASDAKGEDKEGTGAVPGPAGTAEVV